MWLASRIPFGSPRLSKLTSYLPTSEGRGGEELADSMTLHLSIAKEKVNEICLHPAEENQEPTFDEKVYMNDSLLL